MSKKKRVAAVALAAALGCTVFAGCDLISTNTAKDYQQVIAEVNITSSDDFAEGGQYAAYKDVITTTEITKLEMVAYFVSTGYSAMQQNGWTYYDTFAMISDALVNRAIYIQYAMVYLLANGDADGAQYTVEGLTAAIEGAETEEARDLAAMEYFLTDAEKAQAEYSARVIFNNTIDTQEKAIIAAETEDTSSETERTTPTGVDVTNEDYYDTAYKVYTGSNSASDCGSYETLDGSTPSTRTRAYNAFLANLRSNNLLSSGENVNDVGSLSYYQIELSTAYETLLINKMNDKFAQDAAEGIDSELVQRVYDTTFNRQSDAFEDEDTFETALDEMADDSFVLTAPAEGYGYVVNILIPFTTSQSNDLTNYTQDYGDTKGNKFVYRTELLSRVYGTDQRGTWITGSSDYAFDASSVADRYTGTLDNASDRKYLFFEEGIAADPAEGERQYERIQNYLGKYTYNGTVSERADGSYSVSPARISIDDFINEMNGYLNSEAATSAVTVEGDEYTVNGSYVNGIDAETGLLASVDDNTTYFSKGVSDYYTQDEDGNTVVDYSKFIYYAGSVNFTNGFDANELFLEGAAENVVYSAINELSFAYNTDTAGLNTYLGYAVSIGNTDYVDEFEYAAQYVCRLGAGNYVVVATDYGWHIIYCTFSFLAEEDGTIQPFVYDDAEKDVEGTFSYLFYEALRADIVEQYQTRAQTDAINAYQSCATVYEDRYADLSGLDTAS